MKFRILHQDPQLVIIDKPAGFHTHPPEDQSHRISRGQNCLFLLGRQLGAYLYPVHRLDRATSGVLMFALQVEAARALASQFQQQQVTKTYYAVVRGWTEDQGEIDHPLRELDSDPKPSRTSYRTVGRLEIAEPIGRYLTGRYSLVKVSPHSGRMHQIRRHFAHISHPLIPDPIYGDGVHNRYFRGTLGFSTLLLKARSLEFTHPESGARLRVHGKWTGDWQRVFERFGVCPFDNRVGPL